MVFRERSNDSGHENVANKVYCGRNYRRSSSPRPYCQSDVESRWVLRFFEDFRNKRDTTLQKIPTRRCWSHTHLLTNVLSSASVGHLGILCRLPQRKGKNHTSNSRYGIERQSLAQSPRTKTWPIAFVAESWEEHLVMRKWPGLSTNQISSMPCGQSFDRALV